MRCAATGLDFDRQPGLDVLEAAGHDFPDTGLVPGRSYGYRIFARDAFGNEAARHRLVTVAGSAAAPGECAQQVLADQPGNYGAWAKPAGPPEWTWQARTI